MKRSLSMLPALCGLLLMTACTKKEGVEEPDIGVIGVAECDDYVSKYRACMAKMTPEAQSQARVRFTPQEAALRTAAALPEARTALANQCRVALDAMRST